MTDHNYVLTLSSDGDGVVHLHADSKGLDRLIDSLNRLKVHLDKGECEHDHFMTESWAGVDLTEDNGIIEKDHKTVHHLKMMAWTEEWAEKHGLKKKG